MSSGNRIHELLAAAGIDWQRSRASFIEQHGVTRCPWLDIDIVLVGGGTPPLRGMLRPLDFRCHPQWATSQPPLEFHGFIHVSPDWSVNLDTALSELSVFLGSPEKDDASNMRGWRWRDGEAAITIRGWPPQLQFPYYNVMHEREPRTKVACHLTIATGFRPECTPAERALLEAFVPIAALPERTERDFSGAERLSPFELEYIRRLPGDFRHLCGQIGRAGDRVIWANAHLHVVPLHEVKKVTVIRCRPARGPGYGGVDLVCVSSAAGGCAKSLKLGVHRRLDGLDAWAEGLAKSLDRPLEIEESDDD